MFRAGWFSSLDSNGIQRNQHDVHQASLKYPAIVQAYGDLTTKVEGYETLAKCATFFQEFSVSVPVKFAVFSKTLPCLFVSCG